jgi:two-component system sensor histidine kinase YesM
MGIAYRTADKNYISLQEILNIMYSHNAKIQSIVKPISSNDIYENITSNIIRSLIERSYLKEQLEKNKYHNQALELMALQAQMNPHFLFNTMETIYWKTFGLTKSPNESTALIEWLSDMLRYSLTSQPLPVTVSDEIANTKNYINIQQIRFQDRFQVIWKVDERAASAQILKLLIQPLVENCLTHAMFREKIILIQIRVRLLPGDESIQITVADNGRGIAVGELENIREKLKQGFTPDNHVGLFNTNKRILLTYGERASFSIYSREGIGTIVKLVYPVS